MKRPYPLSVIPVFSSLFYSSLAHGLPRYWYRILPYIIKDILFSPVTAFEYLKYTSQIVNLKLNEDPIFILGHWRSGTTLMHNLMIQNNNFGYQNVYKKILPKEFLTTESTLSGLIQYVASLFGLQLQFQRRNWDNQAPSEEDIAFLSLGIKQSSMWIHAFPNLFDDLKKYLDLNSIPKKEIKDWKIVFDFWVKKVALANENKTLVLKNPSNTARIPHILELYPKAKFVYIHRHPLEVYSSTIKAWEFSQKAYSFEKVSTNKIQNIVLHTYDTLITSYETNKHLISPKNLIEIYYEDLTKNPINVFLQILSKWEYEIDDSTLRKVQNFVQTEAKHKRDKHPFKNIEADTKEFMQSFKINERYF